MQSWTSDAPSHLQHLGMTLSSKAYANIKGAVFSNNAGSMQYTVDYTQATTELFPFETKTLALHVQVSTRLKVYSSFSDVPCFQNDAMSLTLDYWPPPSSSECFNPGFCSHDDAS